MEGGCRHKVPLKVEELLVVDGFWKMDSYLFQECDPLVDYHTLVCRYTPELYEQSKLDSVSLKIMTKLDGY